jgi:hypothetical protein
MFAFLFDRKSGVVTGIVVAALAALLFGGGVLVGLTSRWSQQEAADWVASTEAWIPEAVLPKAVAKPAAALEKGTGKAKDKGAPQAGADAPTSDAPTADAPAPADREEEPPPEEPPAGEWVPLAPSDTSPQQQPAPSPQPAAPPPAVVPPASAPPPPTAGGFYVQVGAYASTANAEVKRAELASRFRGAPFAPFLAPLASPPGAGGRESVTGVRVAVRLGPFTSHEAARRVADALGRTVVVGRSD